MGHDCGSKRGQKDAVCRPRLVDDKGWHLHGEIPAKIEGITFGPDPRRGGETIHTLWVANDNDFLTEVPDATGAIIPNPTNSSCLGSKIPTLAVRVLYRSSAMIGRLGR